MQAVKGHGSVIQILKGQYQYFSLRAKALILRVFDRKGCNRTNLPVPPPMLRYRVHGGLRLEGYLKVGENCANDIRSLLFSAGRDLYDCKRVLDFGCGNGRVIRFFYDKPQSCHLYGTDIDKESIGWCSKHLPLALWDVNNFMPPMQYENDTFDCIYAISVFTHIDEEMQFSWLKELHRIAQPGGVLLLTVHGESSFYQLTDAKRCTLQEKGIYFDVGQTGRFKHDGLPDFYQTTYHTRKYIDEKWSSYFSIIGYKERGINAHQDAVILRKV